PSGREHGAARPAAGARMPRPAQRRRLPGPCAGAPAHGRGGPPLAPRRRPLTSCTGWRSAGRTQPAACRPLLEAGAHLCSSRSMKPRPSPCAARGTRRATGLTLVEILVTLSIVALLMTLAVPSLKPTLERWRVQQALGTLTDTLR